jgi:PKD repeat protein
MDKRTILAIVVALLLGLGFIVYQKMIKKRELVKAQIRSSTAKTKIDDSISFESLTPNAKSWKWTFGDNGAVGTTQKVNHSFSEPGTYVVTLQITGDFGIASDSLKITIIDTSAIATAPVLVTPPPVVKDTSVKRPTKPTLIIGGPGSMTPKPKPSTVKVPVAKKHRSNSTRESAPVYDPNAIKGASVREIKK